MPSTVLPNARVGPFPVRTPFLQTQPKASGGGTQGDQPTSTISFAHTKFQQTLANAANSSVQINTAVPASSTSPGQPGSIAYDAGNLYVCVSANSWLKFPGTTF